MIVDTLEQKLNAASETQKHSLGDIYYDRGNAYRYVKATTAFTAGQVAMTEAVTSLDVVLSGKAGTAADGDTFEGTDYVGKQIIYYATGGLTANAYRGYYGIVDDSTTAAEENQTFVVVGNTADTLYIETALTTALADADVDITLFNPNHVAPMTASTQVVPVGAAQIAVTDEYYFWMQYAGVGDVLIGGATQTAGLMVVTQDDAAGSTALVANGNDLFDVNIVGYIMAGGGQADTTVIVKFMIP